MQAGAATAGQTVCATVPVSAEPRPGPALVLLALGVSAPSQESATVSWKSGATDGAPRPDEERPAGSLPAGRVVSDRCREGC